MSEYTDWSGPRELRALNIEETYCDWIHRWITGLSGLVNTTQKALDLVCQENPLSRDTALQNRVRTLLKHLQEADVPDEVAPHLAQILLSTPVV